MFQYVYFQIYYTSQFLLTNTCNFVFLNKYKLVGLTLRDSNFKWRKISPSWLVVTTVRIPKRYSNLYFNNKKLPKIPKIQQMTILRTKGSLRPSKSSKCTFSHLPEHPDHQYGVNDVSLQFWMVAMPLRIPKRYNNLNFNNKKFIKTLKIF